MALKNSAQISVFHEAATTNGFVLSHHAMRAMTSGLEQRYVQFTERASSATAVPVFMLSCTIKGVPLRESGWRG